MDNEQLCHVAKLIAKRHYIEQMGLPSERIRQYVRMRHEYGLTLAPDSSRTDGGQMARLRSEYFWREQINAVADSHREHLAMQGRQLGDPAKGLLPYCSDATYQMFETRLEAITSRLSGQQLDLCPGATKASVYQDSQRAKFNRLYLSGKGMVALAQQRHYTWALITLTCPAKYHPSSPQYDGSSFKDGHDYLQQIYRKLFRHLGKTYKANENYFGIRVVEAHLDGCPHWHIILFSTDDFFARLTAKLSSIYSDGSRPAGYFESNQKDIVRLSSSDEFVSTPLSYIYKHLAFGLQRMRTYEENCVSKRNLYAIKSAGVRQIQLIGTNGLATKLSALRKVARCREAPEHLKVIASELVHTPTPLGRQAQLSGVVKLLDNQLAQLELIRIPTVNRYGEQSTRLAAIKHKLDPVAHELRSSFGLIYQGGALTVNDLNIEKSRELAGTLISNLFSTAYKENDDKATPTAQANKRPETHHTKAPSPTLLSSDAVPVRLRWRPPWFIGNDQAWPKAQVSIEQARDSPQLDAVVSLIGGQNSHGLQPEVPQASRARGSSGPRVMGNP